MNRREVLGGLAGLASIPFAVMASPVLRSAVEAVKYGPIDVDRYAVLKDQGIRLRVLHQGQDITEGCYFADDTGLGYAKRYMLNAEGNRYLRYVADHRPVLHYGVSGAREVAEETVYGVTIVEGEPLR